MQPIYDQLVSGIKAMILEGELKENTPLPSVRGLASELKISALTVKKAYDILEDEGLIVTVHGKGSFVAEINQGLMQEERRRKIEKKLADAVEEGRAAGMSDDELVELFNIIMEDT